MTREPFLVVARRLLPPELVEKVEEAMGVEPRDLGDRKAFDLGFNKGRHTGLQEVQALAPHEVTCRCARGGGEFEWRSHNERCPRYQIGTLLEALRGSTGGLPKDPTPVETFDIEKIGAIAAAFHEEYEEAAADNGWEVREDCRVPWHRLPDKNKATMLATVESLLKRGVIKPGEKL